MNEQVSAPVNTVSYFVLINRVLTSILAAVLAVTVGIGAYFGLVKLISLDVASLKAMNFVLLLILSFSFLVFNLVFQALANYFFKLLEKETYLRLGNNFLKNLLLSFSSSVIVIILGFALFSLTSLAGIIALSIQVYLNFVLGSIIRENRKAFLVSYLYGTVIGVVLSVLLIALSADSVISTEILLGFLGLVLTALIASGTEFVGVSLITLFQNTELQQKEPEDESSSPTFVS